MIDHLDDAALQDLTPILELKIPPPVVALGVGLLMWFVAGVVPSFDLPHTLRVGAALAIGLAGLGLDLLGLLAFRRAKTTINPLRPAASTSLVSTGIYGYTRNPMYLGLLLVLLGWAAFLASVGALLCVPLFVLYIGHFQIAPEERALAGHFGAAFADYRRRVRRWL